MNPNNGPLGITITDKLVYNTCITYLKNAGVTVIGYIHTKTGFPNINGYRAIADVKADIDEWFNSYSINGIFVDEVSNVWPDPAYDSAVIT